MSNEIVDDVEALPKLDDNVHFLRHRLFTKIFVQFT